MNMAAGVEREAASMFGCSFSLSPYSRLMWQVSSGITRQQQHAGNRSARPDVARH
jgi:hypothetical protein